MQHHHHQPFNSFCANYQSNNSATTTTAQSIRNETNQLYLTQPQTAQFNETFYFNTSSTSSSTSSNHIEQTPPAATPTTTFDYYNHDSDALIADLDFLLSHNNSNHFNRTANKINVNNTIQRPQPLSTPAILTSHHSFNHHNLLLDDDEYNNVIDEHRTDFQPQQTNDLDSIILQQQQFQVPSNTNYYLVSESDENRFNANHQLPMIDLGNDVKNVINCTLDQPVIKTIDETLTKTAKQRTSKQPCSIKVNKLNKKRNVKDILKWTKTCDDDLSPISSNETHYYQAKKRIKQLVELRQPDNDDSKLKRNDEFKCWVCGDRSSGNHYGALTCEACKLFFRRHSNLTSNKSNSTSSSLSSSPNSSEATKMQHCLKRSCQVTPNTRGSCPECRYRKCIAVGMGLNRTTFGRHTTNQKVRYNSRVTDLFAEIMKLFFKLRNKIENLNFNSVSKMSQSLRTNIRVNSTHRGLLIPLSTSLTNQSNLIIIENRYDLEISLSKFYNEVIDLMTPTTQATSQIKQELNHLNRTKITNNILIAFCLIFGYNLKLSTEPTNICMNQIQIQHICKQIKEIEEEFRTFAQRVKIIYFLLIMYTSFSVNSLEEQDDFSTTKIKVNNFNYIQPNTAATTNSNTTTNGCTNRLFEDFMEDNSNIQRTFLDLLNSELDFQQNTVASARVSLLLKLDQFI